MLYILKFYMGRNKMNCSLVIISREPQDCIEDKCYFWDLDPGKCKWM